MIPGAIDSTGNIWSVDREGFDLLTASACLEGTLDMLDAAAVEWGGGGGGGANGLNTSVSIGGVGGGAIVVAGTRGIVFPVLAATS